MTARKQRVCLDARFIDGISGGVQQFIIGLASGLSNLTDGHEEYLFLTYADAEEWIQPYVSGPCRILGGPPAPPQPSPCKKRLNIIMPTVVDAYRKLKSLAPRRPIKPPRSNGRIENAGVDLMHFTTQAGFLTDVPSIYHPWDLQHLHLPQYFSRCCRRDREIMYRTFCEQARMVAVASSWVKRDLISHYGLPAAKVQVVPPAPVLTAYRSPSQHDVMAARKKFSLPEAFIFYPAQTWVHKNHIALLEALAILRKRFGLTVPFVSSGRLNSFYPRILKRARKLRLVDQLRFLGFVTPLQLQCLYELCRCMVFPTKFEGCGMPLMEAFLAGVPVACSNVTCLPEQAGDAALIFNPDRPEEIAQAIRRLWTDETLCGSLVERGRKRVERFTWERTARLFRAHYRRLANRTLTEEDRALLRAPTFL